jgi:membrane protein DedA with SNARE-associated domain
MAPDDAPAPSRLRLTLLLTPIGVMTILGNIGAWFGPALIVHHPLLEIFLNPGNRYLALAANEVSTAAFFTVGFARLVLTDPIWYLLGLWYGDDALAWAKARSPGTARTIERLERWFARARDPIVFIAPNGPICLLAGATKMPVLRFAVLNLTGTIARLVLIWKLADVFSGPLGAVSRFIDRYQWWLVSVSLAIVFLQVARNQRQTPDDTRTESEDDGETAAT